MDSEFDGVYCSVYKAIMELLGVLLPLIIDLVSRRVSNSDVRFWISVGICAVVGAFINWITTEFHFSNPQLAFDSISKSILSVFGIAQLSYKAIWENSDLRSTMGLDIH